jgi:integral membrane sensor domain MASE1
MHTLLPGHNIYLIELPLLIVLISLVYSATRFEEWGAILYEAVRWGLRLVLFLIAIGIVLYILHHFNSVVLALLASLVLVACFIALNVRQRAT